MVNGQLDRRLCLLTQVRSKAYADGSAWADRMKALMLNTVETRKSVTNHGKKEKVVDLMAHLGPLNWPSAAFKTDGTHSLRGRPTRRTKASVAGRSDASAKLTVHKGLD